MARVLRSSPLPQSGELAYISVDPPSILDAPWCIWSLLSFKLQRSSTAAFTPGLSAASLLLKRQLVLSNDCFSGASLPASLESCCCQLSCLQRGQRGSDGCTDRPRALSLLEPTLNAQALWLGMHSLGTRACQLSFLACAGFAPRVITRLYSPVKWQEPPPIT